MCLFSNVRGPSQTLYKMISTLFIPLLVEVCVVFVADICFAFLFLKFTRLREGPGQLIMAQTQAQIIVDLHWLLILSVEISDQACFFLSLVANYMLFVSCTYTAAICVAVSLHFDQPKYPNLWRYNSVVLGFSCIYLILAIFLSGSPGIDTSSCSIEQDSGEGLTK